MRVSVCFFYQAEDGIRDTSVTGVQTCALPILHRLLARCQVNDAETRVSQSCGLVRVDAQVVWPSVPKLPGHAHEMIGIYALRSEERRVGDERKATGYSGRGRSTERVVAICGSG